MTKIRLFITPHLHLSRKGREKWKVFSEESVTIVSTITAKDENTYPSPLIPLPQGARKMEEGSIFGGMTKENRMAMLPRYEVRGPA